MADLNGPVMVNHGNLNVYKDVVSIMFIRRERVTRYLVDFTSF